MTCQSHTCFVTCFKKVSESSCQAYVQQVGFRNNLSTRCTNRLVLYFQHYLTSVEITVQIVRSSLKLNSEYSLVFLYKE